MGSETRTRRSAWHANIGFSVRTFGPSARETFIRRFISAIRMDGDGWRKEIAHLLFSSLPHKKKTTSAHTLAHTANNFLRRQVLREPTDRQRGRTNDVKTRANVLLILSIAENLGTRARRGFPKFFVCVVVVVCARGRVIFIARCKNGANSRARKWQTVFFPQTQ